MTCAIAVTGVFYEWVRGTLSRHRARRTVSGGIRQVAVGQQAQIWRLRSSPFDHDACGRRHCFLLLRSSARLRHDNLAIRGRSGSTASPTSATRTRRFRTVKRSAPGSRCSRETAIWVSWRLFAPSIRRSESPRTQGAIHSTVMEDFYIVPSEFTSEGQSGLSRSHQTDGLVDVGLWSRSAAWLPVGAFPQEASRAGQGHGSGGRPNRGRVTAVARNRRHSAGTGSRRLYPVAVYSWAEPGRIRLRRGRSPRKT